MQEEEVYDSFCAFCELLAMLSWIPTLVNLTSVGQQVLAVAFLIFVDWSLLCLSLISWLTCPIDWSLLLPSADCVLLLTDLSCRLISGTYVSSSFWSCGRSLCGFRAKTDKGILWLAPTHTEMDATYSVTHAYHTFFCKCHMVCICQLQKIWWQSSVQVVCLIWHQFE